MKKFYCVEARTNELTNTYQMFVYEDKESRDKFYSRMKIRYDHVYKRTVGVSDPDKVADYEFLAFLTKTNQEEA